MGAGQMLELITDRRQGRTAQRQLIDSFRRRAEYVGTERIGFQGGAREAKTTWHEDVGIWAALDPKAPAARGAGRYWNAFGMDDPREVSSLSITTEVNPPWQGVRASVAGAFARDRSTEKVVLLHRGLIGGGRPGIGKELFWKHWRGATVSVWDGTKFVDMAVVAELGSDGIASQIAWFVREVERIKTMVGKRVSGRRSADANLPGFSPEFGGTRSYQTSGQVIGTVEHGPVVDRLNALLSSAGLRCGNDRERDLFVGSSRGNVRAVFEVKTGADRQSVYTGIGQLMLNGRSAAPQSELVLVLPASKRTAALRPRLRDLGVQLLPYTRRGKALRFDGLDKVIRRLK